MPISWRCFTLFQAKCLTYSRIWADLFWPKEKSSKPAKIAESAFAVEFFPLIFADEEKPAISFGPLANWLSGLLTKAEVGANWSTRKFAFYVLALYLASKGVTQLRREKCLQQFSAFPSVQVQSHYHKLCHVLAQCEGNFSRAGNFYRIIELCDG